MTVSAVSWKEVNCSTYSVQFWYGITGEWADLGEADTLAAARSRVAGLIKSDKGTEREGTTYRIEAITTTEITSYA